MPITDTLKKAVSDATPVYAAVGATDLAVERVREARAQAEKTREQLSKQAAEAREEYTFDKLSERAQTAATAFVDQVQAYPGVAAQRGSAAAAKAQSSYEDLATRGADLVKRIREQKATQDLLAQAESTIALGKGAVTSVRHAASDIERSAKATFTVGRREAATTAQTVAESVADEVDTTAEEVKASAKRTRAAAKSTATTTKKRASTAKRSTKAASTSARKTASKGATAAEKAADKVGD
jgi:heparin binding hemagglutinin HbhA